MRDIDLFCTRDLEAGIIGAILSSPMRIEDIENIDSSDFVEHTHRRIFQFILNNYKQYNNQLTLESAISTDEMIESIRGMEFIRHLIDIRWYAKDLQSYIDVVVDNSRKRKLLRLMEEAKENILTNNEKKFDLLQQDTENILLQQDYKKEEGRMRTFEEISIDFFERLSSDDEMVKSYKSGFEPIDNLIGGYKAKTLNLIAARSGMGKTTFSLNLAINTVKTTPVLYFSLEMSERQLVNKIYACLSDIEFKKIESKNLSADENERVFISSKNAKNPLNIIDCECTTTKIRSEIRRFILKNNIKPLVIIDYLQNIAIPETKNKNERNRYLEVSKISNDLLKIAKEFDVAIVALAQMNRSFDSRQNKTPVLSDLRESGSLEQDADTVTFIYAEEPFLINKKILNFYVAKNRNGETGEVKMKFSGEKCKFSEKIEFFDMV